MSFQGKFSKIFLVICFRKNNKIQRPGKKLIFLEMIAPHRRHRHRHCYCCYYYNELINCVSLFPSG